jgi:hypothetical protein
MGLLSAVATSARTATSLTDSFIADRDCEVRANSGHSIARSATFGMTVHKGEAVMRAENLDRLEWVGSGC